MDNVIKQEGIDEGDVKLIEDYMDNLAQQGYSLKEVTAFGEEAYDTLFKLKDIDLTDLDNILVDDINEQLIQVGDNLGVDVEDWDIIEFTKQYKEAVEDTKDPEMLAYWEEAYKLFLGIRGVNLKSSLSSISELDKNMGVLLEDWEGLTDGTMTFDEVVSSLQTTLGLTSEEAKNVASSLGNIDWSVMYAGASTPSAKQQVVDYSTKDFKSSFAENMGFEVKGDFDGDFKKWVLDKKEEGLSADEIVNVASHNYAEIDTKNNPDSNMTEAEYKPMLNPMVYDAYGVSKSSTTDITPMQDTSIVFDPNKDYGTSADSFSQSYDFSSTIEKLEPTFKSLDKATEHLHLNLETINKGSITDYISKLEELEKTTATTKEEYDNNQLAVAKINEALDEFGSGLKSVSKSFIEIVGDDKYGISAFTSDKDKELIANRELFFGYGIETSNTKDFQSTTQSFIDENFVKGALSDGVITLDEVLSSSNLTQENIDELNRFLPITTTRLKEEDQAHINYIKTYEENRVNFEHSLASDKTFFGEWSRNTSDIKAEGANLGLEGIGELIKDRLSDIYDDSNSELEAKLKPFGKSLEDFSSVDEARLYLENNAITYGNIMIEGVKAQEESVNAQEEYTKSLKKSADTLLFNSLNFAHGLNRDNVFYGNLAFSKKDIQAFGATKSIDTIQEQSVDESTKIWKSIRNDDYDSLANILLKYGVKQEQIDAQYKKEDGTYDVNQMGQDILGQQEQFWNLQAEGYYRVEDFKKSFENFGDNFLTESQKVDNALKFFNFDKATLNIEDFTKVVNGSIDNISLEDMDKFQADSQIVVSYLNNLKSSLTDFNKSLSEEIDNMSFDISTLSFSDISTKIANLDFNGEMDDLNKIKSLITDRYNYEKQQLQNQKGFITSALTK